MRKKFFTYLILLSCISHLHASPLNHEDKILRKVVAAYRVEPITTRTLFMGPKEKLGQALFFDPVMGGPNNTTCATCHVRSKGSVDGLPMAVGIGSSGVGEQRLESPEAFVIPRNVLPFFNRGESAFTALFWDGRVQIGENGDFESPMGNKLPKGFDNLLAVAASFPQVEPDEMLGRSARRGGEKEATYHADLVDMTVDPDNFQERTLNVYSNLIKRLLGASISSTPMQAEYRELFKSAYPTASEFDITHIGNALAAYISLAFQIKPAAWDSYVSGDNSALSQQQKKGALIFFGKGRCAVCHTGKEFSDFKYHGLAVPQLDVGKHGGYLDYGRAKATGRAIDRFQFRTPPLRNVTRTGPWGHNGVFKSLEEVISHHFNPIPLMFAAQQGRPREAELAGRLLRYRSPILAEIYPMAPNDVQAVITFLEALQSDPILSTVEALPKSVPSGMNQFIVE
ncbi:MULTISPECIES: His-Xaa-Ser system-associated MauG-like protein [Pseudomonas]|uniref:His-Xaa-Ser system-associated MauG-like protein n=1 Tax=Pseudomonas TaxID=286 RepID=UPI0025E4A6C3|nr:MULTISPECIES: His-Xaa-Ser system-associated MauG-like protein [Pseudomonas]